MPLTAQQFRQRNNKHGKALNERGWMSTALAIQSLKMRKAKQTNKEEASAGVGAGAYEMQMTDLSLRIKLALRSVEKL